MKKRLTLILTALLMSTVCLFAQDEWKTATIINNGTPVTGTLDADHSSVWYKLVVPSDGTVRIDISTTVESLRWNWQFGWINKEGNFVSRESHWNTWAGIGDRDTLTISNAAAGTYYLRLERHSSAGEYKLNYVHTPCSYANDTDSNNEGGTGSTLVSGKTVQGHLGYRDDNDVTDDNDWYKMEVPKDGSIRVIIDQEENKTLKWNIKICWRDKEGRYNDRLSHWNTWAGHTERDTLIIADAGVGTYYLQVSHKEGYGGYSLQYDFTPCVVNTDSEPNDNGGTGDIISIGQSMFGHLGYRYDNNVADREDWYKVEVPKDGTLSVSIDPLSDETLKWNWEICWLDSNGNYNQSVARVNTWSGFSETDTLTIDYAAVGTYYVHVFLKSGYGCYKLKYDYNQYPYIDPEPNNDYANAVDLPFNSEVTGNLGYRNIYGGANDGEDWYKIDNKYGLPMEFSYVPNNEEKAPDADLTLYSLENGELKQIKYEYAHFQSKIINADENLPKGTYYLRIGNRRGNAGSYRLSLGTPMRNYDSNVRVYFTGWPSARLGIPSEYKVTVENVGDQPSGTFLLMIPYSNEYKIIEARLPGKNGYEEVVPMVEDEDEEDQCMILVVPSMAPHSQYSFPIIIEGRVSSKNRAGSNPFEEPDPEKQIDGVWATLAMLTYVVDPMEEAKEATTGFIRDEVVGTLCEYIGNVCDLDLYELADYRENVDKEVDKEMANYVEETGVRAMSQKRIFDYVRGKLIDMIPGWGKLINLGIETHEPVWKLITGPLKRRIKYTRYVNKFDEYYFDGNFWRKRNMAVLDDKHCINSVVKSWDPNEMLGPVGYGDDNYIGKTQTMNYRIMFENKAEATAPAYRIRISDVLDENVFDLSTVRFNGTSHDNAGFGWKMNREGNKLTWDIEGIELPPNMNAPEGEGYVDFSVDLKPGLANNTRIKNKATIIFDYNEPIETNDYVNTLDLNAPEAINDEAILKDGKVVIKCIGSDAESGISHYNYYASYKYGEYQYIGYSDEEFEYTIPEGTDASDFTFVAMAVDNVGNTQTEPGAAVVTGIRKIPYEINSEGGIFTLEGIKVGNGKSTNSLPTGIYILHDGRSTKKVIIK